MTIHQDFPVRRALISVSDKSKLAEFAKKLELLGIEIVSTGGTAAHLRDSGIPVLPVSEVTGFPEILEGRVKTLHPAVHGGILANLDHSATRETLAAHRIAPIGLVVVNLYPFEEAVKKNAADAGRMIEEIDIGGSALLRASAKNHAFVTVLTDPADYDAVLDELSGEARTTTLATRRRLAAKAFARTAAYNSAIATWFSSAAGENPPSTFFLTGKLRQSLRYGENPHQNAAVYRIRRQGRAEPRAGRTRPGQGAELQQPHRRGRGFRADFGVPGRPAGDCDYQARQPLRHGNRRIGAGGLPQGAGLRSCQRLWRDRGLERGFGRGSSPGNSEDFYRGRDRALGQRRGQAGLPGQAECAAAADRRPLAARGTRAVYPLALRRIFGAGRRRCRAR